MKTFRKKWFTLTELVVTMSVVIILATISFISFNWYVSWSRDSKRIVDLESISTSLEIYYKKNGWIYPKPEDFVILSITWSDNKSKPFSYLWFVKDWIDLSFNWIPRDPITQDYYAFWLTIDKKFYEVSCALENYPSDPIWFQLTDKAYAWWVDYAYIVGNYKYKEWYPKHLILLEQSWSIASIPRKDINIWTASWSIFTASWWILVIDKLSDIIPYPIYNTTKYKSVSNISGTDDFQIVPPDISCSWSTDPCVPINCWDNCN